MVYFSLGSCRSTTELRPRTLTSIGSFQIAPSKSALNSELDMDRAQSSTAFMVAQVAFLRRRDTLDIFDEICVEKWSSYAFIFAALAAHSYRGLLRVARQNGSRRSLTEELDSPLWRRRSSQPPWPSHRLRIDPASRRSFRRPINPFASSRRNRPGPC